MALKNFAELIALGNKADSKKTVAVVCAEDSHSLEAVLQKELRSVIQPILIGNSFEIIGLLAELTLDATGVEIIHVETASEAATKGVELVNAGKADILMKGQIQTRDFLKPVVDKKKGIVKESLLTHIVLNEVRDYPKLVLTSDGGMVTLPTLAEKKLIIANAVAVMQRLGYLKPKVAVLAAAETVNPRVVSSQEAAELTRYFQEEQPASCEIAGPISLDLALSKEIAARKQYDNPVAGDADILIGPDMTTMNILGKSMVSLGGGKIAGLICGATVPIVMTSRGSSSEEKYYSIVLATLIGNGGG